MFSVLFICSGDTIKELDFICINNIIIDKIFFHDIIYEKDKIMVNNIKPIWIEMLKIDESQIKFSYDIKSLEKNLGETPRIDYMFGFNIQEIYTYPSTFTLYDMCLEFNEQYKNKSLYHLCKCLEKVLLKNSKFHFFIEYHDETIETNFKKFKQERKEITNDMKKRMKIV